MWEILCLKYPASRDSFWSGSAFSIHEVFRVFVSRDTRSLCVVYFMGTARREELHNQPVTFSGFILVTSGAVVHSYFSSISLIFKFKPSLLL